MRIPATGHRVEALYRRLDCRLVEVPASEDVGGAANVLLPAGLLDVVLANIPNREIGRLQLGAPSFLFVVERPESICLSERVVLENHVDAGAEFLREFFRPLPRAVFETVVNRTVEVLFLEPVRDDGDAVKRAKAVAVAWTERMASCGLIVVDDDRRRDGDPDRAGLWADESTLNNRLQASHERSSLAWRQVLIDVGAPA